MKIWNEVWDYVKMFVIVIVVVLVVNNVVLINAKIPSESMEQTIMTRRPYLWFPYGIWHQLRFLWKTYFQKNERSGAL